MPTVGASLLVGTNNLYDLGGAGSSWRHLYIGSTVQAPRIEGPNLVLSATGAGSNLYLAAANNLVLPAADNITSLGYASGYRWTSVAAVNGTIQTSHVSMKEAFAPLDPLACVQAVLDTDWWEFDYLGDSPSKHQRGYVLGSPDHRTSPLFGLDDRQSANASSDLAVVACALQQALRDLADARARIAALEGASG